MSAIKKLKSDFRNKIRKEIKSLSYLDITEQSDSVFSQLISLDIYKNAKRIGVYLSFNREILIDRFIYKALSSNKQIFVPKTLLRSKQLNFVEIYKTTYLNKLPKNAYNIREPLGGINYTDTPLDFLICPGVAFSRDLCRLGNGFGFYDRAIVTQNKLNPLFRVVGVCLKEQVFDKIPIEKHDEKMDYLVYRRK